MTETLGDYIIRPKATGVDPVTGAPALSTFPPDDLPKAEADTGVPDGSLDTLAKYASAQTLGNPATHTYSSRRADTRSGDANPYTPAVDPDPSFSEIAEFQNAGQQADASTFFDFVEPIGLMTLEWSNSGQFGLTPQTEIEGSDKSWIQQQAQSYGVGGLMGGTDLGNTPPAASGVGILLDDIIDKKSQYLPDSGRPVGTLLSNVEGWDLDVTGQNQPVRPADYNPTKLETATDTLLLMNRYNPSDNTPFITNKDGRIKKSKGWHVYQGQLGKYIAKVSKEHPEISLQNLRRVALALSLRATGHDSAASQIDTGFLADKAAWIPTFEQFAFIRVEAKKLHARLVTADTSLNVGGAAGGKEIGGGNSPYRTAGTHKDAYVPTFELPFAEISDDGDSPDFGEIKRVWPDATWEDYMTHEDNVVGYTGGSRSSFGQLNSYLEPFSGIMPIGMIIVAAAGALVLVGLASLIELIFDGDPPASGRGPLDDKKSNRSFGIFKPHHGNWFIRMLGIPTTQNNWFRSMTHGMRAFYGFAGGMPGVDGAQFDWEQFASGCLNLVQSPGFYASCLRGVVRDGEQIIQAGFDVADTASVAGGFQNVLELVGKTMSSMPVRFLCMMAAMGDQCLMVEGALWKSTLAATPMTLAGQSHVPPAGEMTAWYRSFLEWYPDLATDRETLGSMNKIELVIRADDTIGPTTKTGLDKLTWRNQQSPGIMLLPMSFIRAQGGSALFPGQSATILGSGGSEDASVKTRDGTQHPGGGENAPSPPVAGGKGRGLDENADDSQMYIKMTPRARLSNAFVTMIENRLELEYMPFYFHDLRTNEVISFHAFMDSISDSFSAEYDSSGGFGRIDDVYIYKKTKRTINLTFWVVSTGNDDFNLMWEKINKLTTLLYPQWSPGRMVSTGLQTFRMPFSQIPTASPMIRLRFGDVIKTNYSKFNLERLFGVQDAFSAGSNFNLDPTRSQLILEHTNATIRVRMGVKYAIAMGEFSSGYGLSESQPILPVADVALHIPGMPGGNADAYTPNTAEELATIAKNSIPIGTEIGFHAWSAEDLHKIDVTKTSVFIVGEPTKAFQRLALLKGANQGVSAVPVTVTAADSSALMDKWGKAVTAESQFIHWSWSGTPLPVYIRKKYIVIDPVTHSGGYYSRGIVGYKEVFNSTAIMADAEKRDAALSDANQNLSPSQKAKLADGEADAATLEIAAEPLEVSYSIWYEVGLQPGVQEKINFAALRARGGEIAKALGNHPTKRGATAGNIVFPYIKSTELTMDLGYLGRIQAPLTGKFEVLQKSAEELEGEQQFFNPQHNAIVRSFQSSGGRGLPGFITSMDLDYNNAPFETDVLGSKAPMWLKITMNFQPVHDIAPGIDASGMNRAPIYNVGKKMHQTAGPISDGDNAAWDIFGRGGGATDDMFKTYNDAAGKQLNQSLMKQYEARNAAREDED